MFHLQWGRFGAYDKRVFNVDHIEPVMPRQSVLSKSEARGPQKAHQDYEDQARRCGWLFSEQKREYQTEMGFPERFHQ